ncbi:MAG: outer membrane beta-barrel protein [Alphaproteobacteria bacterium]
MNKKLLIASLVVSSIVGTSLKADAFYVGAGVGSSKTKVRVDDLDIKGDEKTAFSVYSGMEIPLPLIPIRAEIEYLHLKSDKDGNDATTYGASANAYVGLPLLPIIKPYVGMGLGYMQQELKMPLIDEDNGLILGKLKDKSDWTVVPQYMLGFDISLPLIPIAGGVEYRYIDTKFKGFNDDDGDFSAKSKIHTFLVKARVKF